MPRGVVPGHGGKPWSFLKFQVDDLRRLYGIDVAELNVWRPVEEHVVEHFDRDDLLTVEVDSWYLPDTSGTSYRTEHVKTTIVPVEIDTRARRLTYLHNAGQFALDGDDYLGALAFPLSGSHVSEPYIELVRLSGSRPDIATLPQRARALAEDHLARSPQDNPALRLADEMRSGVARLREQGMPYFHVYSFATTRQIGLSAQAAADGLGWLSRSSAVDASAATDLRAAIAHFTDVSEGAKRVQFNLARIASGRDRPLDPALADVAESWGRAMDLTRDTLLG